MWRSEKVLKKQRGRDGPGVRTGEMGTQAGVWCLDPRSPYLASYDLSPQTAQLPHCVIGAGGNRAQKEAREKGERTTKSLALELHQRLAS